MYYYTGHGDNENFQRRKQPQPLQWQLDDKDSLSVNEKNRIVIERSRKLERWNCCIQGIKPTAESADSPIQATDGYELGLLYNGTSMKKSLITLIR